MSFETPASLALTITFLLLGMAAEHIVHERLHWHFIPEGGTSICIGALIGMVDSLSGDALGELTSFEPFLFEYALLPFVIFGAGYSLRKRSLFENFGTILTYAFAGTLISVLVVSFGIYKMFGYSIYECMMFGSLISAVDPVATLAVMSSVFDVEKRVKPPTLYSLVFGESILNDAVAIVLFETFHIFYNMEDPDNFTAEIPKIVGDFLKIFIMSVVYGIVVGIMTALAFKYLKLNGFLIWEFAGIMLCAYLSYVLASVSGFSGLISIFFCGITMSDYTWMNFSEIGKMTVHRCVLALAYCAETMIFVYLGMAIFSFQHHYNVKMIFVTLGLCLLGRSIGIFGLTPLLNCGRKRPITFSEQIVLWFSGLRGAIAFALSVELFEISEGGAISIDPISGHEYAHTEEEIEASEYFVTTTLIVVLITTYICGALTSPLMSCLNIQSDQDITSSIENQERPTGVLGFLTRLNAWVKQKVTRELDSSEMLFEGDLALRLDRIVPAKEVHNLQSYFKVFYDKQVRALSPVERTQLATELHEYNRSSLSKDPVGILKGATYHSAYDLMTPLIGDNERSQMDMGNIHSNRVIQKPRSEPVILNKTLLAKVEEKNIEQSETVEDVQPKPSDTSNEANLLGIQ